MNGKQKRYTEEQRRDIVQRYRDRGEMTQAEFCRLEGVTAFSVNSWMRNYKRKSRKGETPPEPDHERDIAALQVLNSAPVALPAPSVDDADERVARILGATIAEVLRRMKG